MKIDKNKSVSNLKSESVVTVLERTELDLNPKDGLSESLNKKDVQCSKKLNDKKTSKCCKRKTRLQFISGTFFIISVFCVLFAFLGPDIYIKRVLSKIQNKRV